MKKIYILDTNVLLSNHLAPLSFDEHTVVIPMAVLGELDDIKMRKNDLSRDARAAIRVLEDIIGDTDGNLEEGILINSSGICDVHEDATLIISPMPPALNPSINNDCPDNIIINTALFYQNKDEMTYSEGDSEINFGNSNEVVLVSNDINLRLKAKGAKMRHTQPLKSDIVIDDIDYLPQGLYLVPDNWFESLSEVESVEQKSCGKILLPVSLFPFSISNHEELISSWLYNKTDDFAAEIIEFTEVDNEIICELKFNRLSDIAKRKVAGVSGKTTNQILAIHSLMDREKDIVILFGPAGSGKTLLACAAATEMVKGKKSYAKEEILFGKTMDSQFEELGFLPGNEHEKLAPWAGAVYDNMEEISRLSKIADFHPTQSIENEKTCFIKLKNLGFMRGRSLNYKVLIIDEAQNLNAKQMRTLLSRAGANCKIILMGNLKQIDNDYVSENSSGLTYICKKFAKWPRASIIHLESGERSPLADFVENNL